MKRAKKSTIARVTEPVTDAAGAVMNSIKRSVPKVTEELGHVVQSIGEVMSDGVDVVKNVGSKAIEGASHLIPGGTATSPSKRRAEGSSAKTKAKTPTARRETSRVKANASGADAPAKRRPADRKVTPAKAGASISTDRPKSPHGKAPANRARPLGKGTRSKTARRAASKK